MTEQVTGNRKIDEDVEAVKSKLDLEVCMEMAVEAGKSRVGQVLDIFRLSKTTGRLQANEYYYFQLYDDKQFTFEEKTRFASERFGNYLITRTNDVDWHYLSVDKFKAYSHLEAQDFPIPETQAILYEKDRDFDGVPKLSNQQEFESYLKSDARFPIYAKPVFGIGSIGNFLIRGFEDGKVLLHGDDDMEIGEFYRKVEPKHAYMLQTLLTPHQDLVDVTPHISTVRLVIMIQDGQPKIIHSLWKIPAAENIADNFWRKGNMLANVDFHTGQVNRLIRGTGPWLEELDKHPVSGIDMNGFQIPYWSDIVEMCKEGAKAFSPLRFQSWDIGLAPEGPVVVEVNSGSALGLAQLAQGKGFLTDEFLGFLSDHDCKLKRRPKLRRRAGRGSSSPVSELPKVPVPTLGKPTESKPAEQDELAGSR